MDIIKAIWLVIWRSCALYGQYGMKKMWLFMNVVRGALSKQGEEFLFEIIACCGLIAASIRFFGFLIFPLVDIWRPFSTLHLFIRVTMSYAAESLRCWHARRGALLDRVFLLSRMQYPYTLCWSFGGSIVIECLKAPRGLGWSWRRSFTRFKAQSFMCFEDNLLQIILQWYFLNVW